MDQQIHALQIAMAMSDTVVRVGFALDMRPGATGVRHGVTLLGPRKKKLSPFIVASDPHPNTPAGALRTLADLLEAT